MTPFTANPTLQSSEKASSNLGISKIDGNNGLFKELEKDLHSVTGYQYIILCKATGTLHINQQIVPITADQLIFLKPSKQNSISLNFLATGYMITFNDSFLQMADRNDGAPGESNFHYLNAEHISVYNRVTDDVRTFTELLLKEFCCKNSYKRELLYSYFRILIIHILRQSNITGKNQNRSRNNDILNDFKATLESSFRTKKMVADYADLLAITPNYLNEVIKKCTGYSAGYHIRQRIALEAKIQANHRNSCMKGIAYDLGFYDLAHFSKFFKNTTGMNFSEYKRQDRLLKPIS
jgi:AraC family transcriptional activator of pobA